MSDFRIAIVVFSPGGNTLKAAKMAETKLVEKGFSVQLLDVTAAKVITNKEKLRSFLQKEIKPHDLLMIGGPVYENRLDKLTLAVIKALPKPDNHTWGNLCIPFVSWGGVTSGIGLWQAAKALRSAGRRVVMAFKIEAFHPFSIAWPERLNEGMPGEEAWPLMDALADAVSNIAAGVPASLPDITNTLNYAPFLPKLFGTVTSVLPTQQYAYKAVRIDPDSCQGCGVCVQRCPVDRLEIRKGSVGVKYNAEKCIHCYTCICVCPSGSRKVSLEGTRGLLLGLKKRYAETPGNVLFT